MKLFISIVTHKESHDERRNKGNNMNLATKSIALDTGISVIITLAGGASFYSFLFLFVILFLPAILVFVSFDIVRGSSKKLPANDSSIKKKVE